MKLQRKIAAYRQVQQDTLSQLYWRLLPGQDLPSNLPPEYYLHAIGFGVPALFAAFAAGTVSAAAIAIGLVACRANSRSTLSRAALFPPMTWSLMCSVLLPVQSSAC